MKELNGSANHPQGEWVKLSKRPRVPREWKNKMSIPLLGSCLGATGLKYPSSRWNRSRPLVGTVARVRARPSADANGQLSISAEVFGMSPSTWSIAVQDRRRRRYATPYRHSQTGCVSLRTESKDIMIRIPTPRAILRTDAPIHLYLKRNPEREPWVRDMPMKRNQASAR